MSTEIQETSISESTENQGTLTSEAAETPSAEATATPPKKPKLTSEEKLVRLRAAYEQRIEELTASNDPVYQQALQVAERLEQEPNVLAVLRMIELFGLELVNQKATEAIIAFKRALKGPKKFPAGEPTVTVNSEGKLRTCGGVFLYLMVQYAQQTTGQTRTQLKLPWYPYELSNTPKRHHKPPKPEATKESQSRSDKRRHKK